MSRSHKIEKQILDLQLTKNEDVYELQSRFRDLFYDRLLPAIEKELDQISSGDDLIMIDRLELDLGELQDLNQIDEVVIEQCVQQIRSQLEPVQIHRESKTDTAKFISDGNIQIVEKDENRRMTYFEALVSFLETGHLPWKVTLDLSENNQQSRIQRLISHVLTYEPQRFFRFLERKVNNTTIQVRLFHHVTYEQVQRIFEQVQITEMKLSATEIDKSIDEVSSVISGASSNQESKKAILWSMYIILTTTSIPKEQLKFYLPMLLELIAKEEKVDITFWKFIIQVARASTSSLPIIKKQLNQFGIDDQVFKKIDNIVQNKKLSSSKKGIEKLSINEWISQKKNILALKNIVPLVEDDIKILVDKIEKSMEENELIEEETVYFDTEKDMDETTQKKVKATEEGISINNSGLVILWPYLKTLFGHFDWIDDAGGLKEDAISKALSLTHYLAFGHEEIDESQLTLNKILLGIDLEEPLTNAYRLTDNEKHEANELIQAVINNWSAIGNVSVEGFRGTFIVRDGIIYDREEMYQLVVERKAFDILMDQLPWSISIARLSWMDKILMTEW